MEEIDLNDEDEQPNGVFSASSIVPTMLPSSSSSSSSSSSRRAITGGHALPSRVGSSASSSSGQSSIQSSSLFKSSWNASQGSNWSGPNIWSNLGHSKRAVIYPNVGHPISPMKKSPPSLISPSKFRRNASMMNKPFPSGSSGSSSHDCENQPTWDSIRDSADLLQFQVCLTPFNTVICLIFKKEHFFILQSSLINFVLSEKSIRRKRDDEFQVKSATNSNDSLFSACLSYSKQSISFIDSIKS